MRPASIAMITGVISGVVSLVRTGLLGYVEIRAILDKYAALPATEEHLAAMRRELLSAAEIGEAVDDPRIRALLLADGIDPESLRIPG